MIYITGDTHGSYERFLESSFPQQKTLTKDDYVIICGDFGIWDDDLTERYNFDWLEERNFTTLFVDGNHENYDLLNAYPVETWHGGDVHFIRPSVIHLMRGNLFEIEGKKIFTMGGAQSHDIQDGILDPSDPDFEEKMKKLYKEHKYFYRVKGQSWWEEELPNDEEYEKALKTLNECNWEVDYIITHCAPYSFVREVLGFDEKNRLTLFFDEMSVKCKYKRWFFGHYHKNYVLNDRFCILYKNIIKLADIRFKFKY